MAFKHQIHLISSGLVAVLQQTYVSSIEPLLTLLHCMLRTDFVILRSEIAYCQIAAKIRTKI
jgi:hypothetical protein